MNKDLINIKERNLSIEFVEIHCCNCSYKQPQRYYVWEILLFGNRRCHR